MMRRLRLLSLGVVALSAGAGLPLLGTTVAGAAGSASTLADGNAGLYMTSNAASAATGTAKPTTNLAGYGVGTTVTPTVATPVTSVVGTVVIPTLACPPTGYFKSNASVQIVRRTNTTTTPDKGYDGGSFLTFTCTAGVAGYSAFLGLATYGSKPFTIAPGNAVTTDIALTSATGYTTITMTATDQTTGVVTKKIVKKKKAVVDNGGWLIVQRVRVPIPTTPHPPFYNVPPFGTVNFSGATVNGQKLSALTPQKYYMEEGTKTKVELVQAKPIDATGSAFTDKFLKSS